MPKHWCARVDFHSRKSTRWRLVWNCPLTEMRYSEWRGECDEWHTYEPHQHSWLRGAKVGAEGLFSWGLWCMCFWSVEGDVESADLLVSPWHTHTVWLVSSAIPALWELQGIGGGIWKGIISVANITCFIIWTMICQIYQYPNSHNWIYYCYGLNVCVSPPPDSYVEALNPQSNDIRR